VLEPTRNRGSEGVDGKNSEDELKSDWSTLSYTTVVITCWQTFNHTFLC